MMPASGTPYKYLIRRLRQQLSLKGKPRVGVPVVCVLMRKEGSSFMTIWNIAHAHEKASFMVEVCFATLSDQSPIAFKLCGIYVALSFQWNIF